MISEENKERQTVPVDVGFVEGRVSYFLEFSIDLLQSYHF